MSFLDKPSERLAYELYWLLRFNAKGFAPVFVFAESEPALALADAFDVRVSPNPVERREAPVDFVDRPEVFLDTLLRSSAPSSSLHFGTKRSEPFRGSIWLFLQQHSSDPRWIRARLSFLANLDEHRIPLEGTLDCPLIIILPEWFKDDARSAAPNLWSSRAFDLHLRARPDAPSPMIQTGSLAAIELSGESLLAYTLWRRKDISGAERSSLSTAWSAIDQLLAQHRPEDAAVVSGRAVEVARTCVASGDVEQDARPELSISLDYVGRTATHQGHWGDAASAYRESLSVRRKFVEDRGDNPHALGAVAFALENVGRASARVGKWNDAAFAYRESLDLRKKLVERIVGKAEALTDVWISLNHLVEAAAAQGNQTVADLAHQERGRVCRLLDERYGVKSRRLSDVLNSLDSVMTKRMLDWSQVERAFLQCIANGRKVVEKLGGTRNAQGDVREALLSFGEAAEAHGQWERAVTAYREHIMITKILVLRVEGAPEAMRDVTRSFERLARVHEIRGDRRNAEICRDESIKVGEFLAEHLGGRPGSRRDLSLLVQQLGRWVYYSAGTTPPRSTT